MYFLVHVILAAVLCTVFAEDQDIMRISPTEAVKTKDRGEDLVLSCYLKVTQKDLVNNFRWLDPRNQTIDQTYARANPKFRIEVEPNEVQRLFFSNLEDAMAGTYTCAVNYDTRPISQSIRVEINQPITFVDAPEYQLARKGDKNFKLKCQVQARPSPTVSWRRKGSKLTSDDKYIIDHDGLIFKDVQESDDGPYVCEVMVESTGSLITRSINLEVISDPVFVNTPDSFNVTEGERAFIPCNATGKPRPTFSWIKAATKKNLTTELSYKGGLNVDRVTKEDDDVFICVASNSAKTIQREIKVSVQSKPQIVEVINSTIVTGKSGQLTCFVFGNPLPNVTIRKLGFKSHAVDTNDVGLTHNLKIESKADSKGRRNTVEAVLKLNNVEKSDDGLYECVASNGIGETVGNLHLTVEYKPYFETSAMPKSVVTWGNRPVNLTCFAYAIPNATITWYYGTNLMELDKVGDSSYKFFTTTGRSTVQVTPTKRQVYGTYKCKAVNLHGEVFYEMKLDEGFIPGAISNVYVNTTTATSVTFQFVDPPSTGNLPIKAYTVQYTHQSQGWNSAKTQVFPASPSGTYMIVDLKPQTRYVFRFRCENEVGEGSWGIEKEIETPPRSEPSEPVLTSRVQDGERYIKSPFANKIELRWNIPADNGLDIDYYVVRVCRITEETFDIAETDSNCQSINIPYNTVLSSYVIEQLTPNTLYRVRLGAHNNIGHSKYSERVYKTNDFDEPGSRTASESYGEKMHNGLSSAVIIYIVIALLVGFFVIVDIFCFFVGKTGVIYKICGGCCFKKQKNDDKLGSESRDLITNGLKNKVDIEEQSPMITDGTKRDTTVEYDVKKGVSKTGFVGKDSAV